MTLSSPPRRSSDLAQRQLDHLAELVDRVAHPADIVIGDVGAARLLRFLIFGTQFDLGMLVDMNDALGGGLDDRKADFLQGIGRRAPIFRELGRENGRAACRASGCQYGEVSVGAVSLK